MLIDQLSLKAKIGQLLLIGFDGCEFTPELEHYLDQYSPGGVILFKRNYQNRQQLIKLCSELQSWAKKQFPAIPLFIAVDHEGGRVQRFRSEFTLLPPAGTIKSAQEAYRIGKTMGRELTGAGINMNLAPVLDVNSNPQNPIIGDRSYGSTPERVIELALPLMLGMMEEGLIAVGKHFPGHGDTSLDSHLALPTVDAAPDILRQRELAPFAAAIGNGLPAIMTAHVLYPAWDGNNPATTSPFILTELLRRQMGFAGVVISDDMLMKALNSDKIEIVAVQSFMAGVDFFIVGDKKDIQINIFESLYKAVQNGLITDSRLDQSLQRIFNLKTKYITRN
ncbi:MAG: beta-N-acetylhexosaminidase [Candidatus Schekmanbacteria bacterium]|nr:beta-N-acetylhexosaminidase [Candidatus Schekmanbacteria bacterium]